MLNEQTIEKLYHMKLNGMAEAFKEQTLQPDLAELSFEERFAFLVERQWTWKEERRMKRLLSQAKLKINACIEGIDFRTPRGLQKSVILQLASCDWIKNAHNVIITGPTGAGKTYPWHAPLPIGPAVWASPPFISVSPSSSTTSLWLRLTDLTQRP